MDYKDYYKILGVDKAATTEEIKKQYRKLARKFHPDVNPGDKSAETKFAEINEAHEVLSDPGKRKKYDTLGADWQQYENYGQGSPFSGSTQSRGGTGYTYSTGDMEDLFGGEGFSDFFRTFFGDIPGGFEKQRRTYTRKGQDFKAELEISLEEAYKGCVKVITVKGETLRITLKAGLRDGQTIKLAGKGAAGSQGGQRGDLYITIRIPLHPRYKQVEDDLFIEVPVSLYKLLLGGEEEIEVISGRYKIKIPPETGNGTTFRLKGKGFSVYNREGFHGDLYVKVLAAMPGNLSKKEKELLGELARIRNVEVGGEK